MSGEEKFINRLMDGKEIGEGKIEIDSSCL
jgi:hypothetical protein